VCSWRGRVSIRGIQLLWLRREVRASRLRAFYGKFICYSPRLIFFFFFFFVLRLSFLSYVLVWEKKH
jgi:hypothetical protein